MANTRIQHLLSRDGILWLLIYILIPFKKAKCFPVKLYLSLEYRCIFGRKLNWKNPTTFNEKLNWLKLYDHNPLYSTMVDKYRVKQYVAKKIGEECVIPSLGCWDFFDDINFEELPDKYVLKTNHDCGGLFIKKDDTKIDIPYLKRFFDARMKVQYYYNGFEWAYKNVRPCIFAEKFMTDPNVGELRDYKFFCFNGKVRCFKVDYGRFVDHHANYYDADGNFLDFGEVAYKRDKDAEVKLPENIHSMIILAEKLSADIPFVRVDLYNVEGHIYFGEMTFFPAGGFGKIDPIEWDLILGSWIELPKLSNKNTL